MVWPLIGEPFKYHWLPVDELELNTVGALAEQITTGPAGLTAGVAGVALMVTVPEPLQSPSIPVQFASLNALMV